MRNRIEQLERSARYFKYGFAGWAALFLALTVAAFRPQEPSDEVLRVRGLVVVDEAGRERILIGAPVPVADHRVRTDPERVRETWAGRYPDPEQYMGYYREYRHDTNGILILDENGFDRLALGDPVPDPNIGRRIGPSTGLAINDEEGFERSGYGLLNVGGEKRVVLGLDSNRGTEGLVLFLYDEGRVGVVVRDQDRSIFLGNAPADDPVSGVSEPFSGLVFREGQQVTRVVEGREP